MTRAHRPGAILATPARSTPSAVMALATAVLMVATVVLTLTTLSVSPAAAAGRAPIPTLRWGACHDPAIPGGYQCATLRVPLDGQEVGSAGPTIGLALDRHLASGRHRIGALLVNPGGPGASGVDALPAIVNLMTPALLADFDVIGFDPPGVGASDPVICLAPGPLAHYLHLDPAPTTAAGLSALVAGDRTFAAGCKQRSGAVLDHVSTVAAARDMDRIRAAVGDASLNYLGFSYGTFLGATYAQLYPKRVRAMVLDGALDPALSATAEIDAQSVAIDGELRALEASCAGAPSCPWKAKKGSTLAATFTALLTRVRAHPLATGTTRTVGPAELLYGTAAGLYSTTTWPLVETALAQAGAGQGAQLLDLFDSYTGRQSNGGYANTIEAETAVNCLDDPVPSVSRLEAAARQVRAIAPVFGPLDVLSEIACSVWPVAATGAPHPIAAVGSPPIVVVGSTGDPVTPYAWAKDLASQLSRGVLLTRVGEGHTGYGASSCVRAAIDRYLIGLHPPTSGTRCASD